MLWSHSEFQEQHKRKNSLWRLFQPPESPHLHSSPVVIYKLHRKWPYVFNVLQKNVKVFFLRIPYYCFLSSRHWSIFSSVLQSWAVKSLDRLTYFIFKLGCYLLSVPHRTLLWFRLFSPTWGFEISERLITSNSSQNWCQFCYIQQRCKSMPLTLGTDSAW